MSRYYEVTTAMDLDPTKIIMSCAESGADTLFFGEHSLPPDFFDLSSGLAGELLHRLSIYNMRMAAIVPDLDAHSSHFQAFVAEANKRDRFRFFTARQQAIAWLESL